MKMNNLYKKYKPKSLDEIFGHERIIKEWQTRFQNKSFPHVMYISGKSGKGKTVLGDIISKALTCEKVDDKGNPCNTCKNCIDVDNEIFSRAVKKYNSSNLDIESTRKIESDILLVNRYSKNTVYIFNEFQELSKSPAAMGNLLMMLEREIPNVYFILIAMDDTSIPEKLRTALKNRTTFYHLKDINPTHLGILLQAIYKAEKGIDANENIIKLISAIVYHSEGSARTAIQYLERLIFSNIQTEDELLEELNIVSENKLFYALTHLVNGDAKSFFTCVPDVNEELFLRLRSILLDLQLYKSGVDIGSSRERMLSTIKNSNIPLSPILDLMFSGHYLYKTEMKYILVKVLNMSKNNTNSTDGSGKKVRRIVNS